MSKKSESVRGWFNQNKIFFEIAASILIGGASLVVSWTALRLNEKVLTATEISSLPHFSLAKRALLDPSSRAYIEETLVLMNNGAPNRRRPDFDITEYAPTTNNSGETTTSSAVTKNKGKLCC